MAMTVERPRLTRLTDEVEIARLRDGIDDLGTPRLLVGEDGSCWALSDELRAWRSAAN